MFEKAVIDNLPWREVQPSLITELPIQVRVPVSIECCLGEVTLQEHVPRIRRPLARDDEGRDREVLNRGDIDPDIRGPSIQIGLAGGMTRAAIL